MSFNTQQLQAYLTGELNETDAAAIEAALEVDAALEQRLMALDPLAMQLEGTAQAIAGPSQDQIMQWSDTQRAAPAQRGYGWKQLVVAACLGAIIAGAGMWMRGSDTAVDWRASVATYQSLYSQQTIAGLQFGEVVLASQLARVGDQVGFSDLGSLAGEIDDLELLRGQILAHEGEPLAQIVFASRTGEPVALCLMARNDGRASEAIEVSYRSGLASATFETKGHSWLLIGTQDQALIAGAARDVLAHLADL